MCSTTLTHTPPPQPTLKNTLLDNEVPPATTQMEHFNRNCVMVHLITFPHQSCTGSASPQQQKRREGPWMYIHDAHQMRTMEITVDDLMDSPEGAGSVQLCLES